MGDRCVYGFTSEPGATPVWLYSHWGGSSRYVALKQAIKVACPRWSDGSYATRIAIESIIGPEPDPHTGFGITAGADMFSLPDWNDVPIIVWSEKTVKIVSDSNVDHVLGKIDFDELLRIPDELLVNEACERMLEDLWDRLEVLKAPAVAPL